MTCVSIYDAMEYAKWMSQQTGHSYRVPSAAEWRYAARAGSAAAQLYIRSHLSDFCGKANHPAFDYSDGRGACDDGVHPTEVVGRFLPNGVGLHDMVGNVAELVLACGRVTPDDRIRFSPHQMVRPRILIAVRNTSLPWEAPTAEWRLHMTVTKSGMRFM